MIFSRDPQVAEQQMTAIIVYCTTFGYIDGKFDLAEKEFIRRYIQSLCEVRIEDSGVTDVRVARDMLDKWKRHYDEVFDRIDAGIFKLFDEVVWGTEEQTRFVFARLKLQCFELFKAFDPENRRRLMAVSQGLIAADGKVHPAEEAFRQELMALLDARTPEPAPFPPSPSGPLPVTGPVQLRPAAENHPVLDQLERHFSRDRGRLARELENDLELVRRCVGLWDEQRQTGHNKLMGKQTVADLAGSGEMLDRYVYSLMPGPGQDYELVVFGDLHGCYSCLKGALLQADFFGKVDRWRRDPRGNPCPKLVFLGDYIDRGIYSYDGIMRAVMQLFVSYPQHVYVLRGNHEYYVLLGGKVAGGVRPAEAIASLEPYAGNDVLEAYRVMFENMPTALIFDRTLFVHAGIPRDETLQQRWRDLSSLNEHEIRFQMMWSDPSTASFIPADLQRENARFPFGKQQFRGFMNRIGCTTMVRGHEKIDEGFKAIFADPDISLLNLFSAGGAQNADLPPESSYRKVTPMALLVRWRNGQASASPFAIDWQSFQSPQRNQFMKRPPELEFRYQ